MRLAFVDKEKCKGGVDCPYICMNVCPINRNGGECITKTDDSKVQIDENLCIGCGICVKRCPAKAISIFNLPEQLTEQPVHRFGKNGFILYSLPQPLFDNAVGVLGVNGIGKTTAVKILAGVLEPNLGKESASFDELLEFFKGSKVQRFFEELRDKKIKIAYKPQNIDLIPKLYSGRVEDLLKKVDETNNFDKIVEEFDLKNILKNDIKKISGGELQRVAIAATFLKDANFYVFDEPTSYLDIKQRMRVAKLIRSLSSEDAAVLVVEHDLIILDYMTDLTNIMFGDAGHYGIVAKLKTTRVAINEYLDGFLKAENVRIRDKPIKFFEKPPANFKETAVLTSWKNIKKKIGKFTLQADEGIIYKNQVIGVLGENGIGKTSFVRILAGELVPDSGSFDKIKASYKPQYLNEAVYDKEDELVVNFLKDAIQKYNIELVRPLNLQPLFMKKISTLSGGELQRVLIAKTLSEEADLYLLDEPSAYLDADQRVKAAKVMKDFATNNKKALLVVDHDLLFLDLISDSLIVFEGKPAELGNVIGPMPMRDGMNRFLKTLGVTLRRDVESKRPRINKEDSRKDREQKSKGEYYYG